MTASQAWLDWIRLRLAPVQLTLACNMTREFAGKFIALASIAIPAVAACSGGGGGSSSCGGTSISDLDPTTAIGDFTAADKAQFL